MKLEEIPFKDNYGGHLQNILTGLNVKNEADIDKIFEWWQLEGKDNYLKIKMNSSDGFDIDKKKVWKESGKMVEAKLTELGIKFTKEKKEKK